MIRTRRMMNEKASVRATAFAKRYAFLEDKAEEGDKRATQWMEDVDEIMMDYLPGLTDDVAYDFDQIKDKKVQDQLWKKSSSWTSLYESYDPYGVEDMDDVNQYPVTSKAIDAAAKALFCAPRYVDYIDEFEDQQEDPFFRQCMSRLGNLRVISPISAKKAADLFGTRDGKLYSVKDDCQILVINDADGYTKLFYNKAQKKDILARFKLRDRYGFNESYGRRRMNESIGMTQSDWEEARPEDYDEGQVEGYIKNFDDAAKALNCKARDILNITEDDGEAYNKIIRRIKKGDKGQKVKMPSIDGSAGLYTLTNGVTVVTTNEWGYGTVFVKKSEVNKAMNESAGFYGRRRMNEGRELCGATLDDRDDLYEVEVQMCRELAKRADVAWKDVEIEYDNSADAPSKRFKVIDRATRGCKSKPIRIPASYEGVYARMIQTPEGYVIRLEDTYSDCIMYFINPYDWN